MSIFASQGLRYLHCRLLLVHNDDTGPPDRHTDVKKGVYNYNDVDGRCKKVPRGNLLKVGASYLPILLVKNHWVSGAISRYLFD